MTSNVVGSVSAMPCTGTVHPVAPMERALMLIALGLDPQFDYTDTQLHGAWRRRMSEVHPDNGGNGVVAAAVNASYLCLCRRVELPVPVDTLL